MIPHQNNHTTNQPNPPPPNCPYGTKHETAFTSFSSSFFPLAVSSLGPRSFPPPPQMKTPLSPGLPTCQPCPQPRISGHPPRKFGLRALCQIATSPFPFFAQFTHIPDLSDCPAHSLFSKSSGPLGFCLSELPFLLAEAVLSSFHVQLFQAALSLPKIPAEGAQPHILRSRPLCPPFSSSLSSLQHRPPPPATKFPWPTNSSLNITSIPPPPFFLPAHSSHEVTPHYQLQRPIPIYSLPHPCLNLGRAPPTFGSPSVYHTCPFPSLLVFHPEHHLRDIVPFSIFRRGTSSYI